MSDPSLEVSSDTCSDPMMVHADTDDEDMPRSSPKLKKVDKKSLLTLLAWYAKFCSSASHQDKLLKVIQWSLSLITSGKWPNKVAMEISFARYVSRLLQLPLALEAVASDSWVTRPRKPSNAQLFKWIGRILAYSMVFYYPAEHMAYVLWMKPSTTTTDPSCPTRRSPSYQWIPTWKPEKWSYLSCRFWCAYIVAELTQNVLQLQELYSDEVSEAENKSAVVDTQLQLARNALFLLPSIHNSLPSWDTQPWLRGRTVTWLMWAEAMVGFYQAYRKSD